MLCHLNPHPSHLTGVGLRLLTLGTGALVWQQQIMGSKILFHVNNVRLQVVSLFLLFVFFTFQLSSSNLYVLLTGIFFKKKRCALYLTQLSNPTIVPASPLWPKRQCCWFRFWCATHRPGQLENCYVNVPSPAA